MNHKQYALLTGTVIDRRAETNGRSPHYQLLVDAGGEHFRVAINTRSGASRGHKADLLYFADDDFRHPVTELLELVDEGCQPVPSRPHGLALDYQRGGMFDRRFMRRIPSSRPGPHNDLIDELNDWVEQALANPDMRLHAYGTRWGPETRLPDQVFDFLPGNGIHDVHMNQGNWDEHRGDNRPWADGGLLLHDTRRKRWGAIFLAFQTQSWHTDEQGNPGERDEREWEHDATVGTDGRTRARIAAAFVHPNDDKDGVEHITIWNDDDEPLDVDGWRIVNREGDGVRLAGTVPPHRGRRVPLPDHVPLSTRGGRIRLLDDQGEEVDAVAYTRQEARRKRGSLTF